MAPCRHRSIFRRTSLFDGTGTTTYAYNEADQLTQVTPPTGGLVQYGYDNAGRRNRVPHRPTGKVYAVAYGYDAAGRQTSVTDWLNKTTTYGYAAAGRLADIAYPNGVATAQTYDTAGRLTGVTHAKSGVTLASVAYTLDDAGNRLTETTAGVPLAGTTTYGYDATDRLTSAAYPGGGSGGWGYDNVGNRTSVATNGTTTYAAYDAANRRCWDGGATAGVCATPTSGATTYTNDAAGNRTAKVAGGVTTTYAYDANNLLKTVATGGTTTATYTYDGDGYRTKKVVGSTTTAYTWDRLGLGGLGTIVAAGTAEQVYGPAGLQQRTVGTASQYAHGDGLGSIRLITDGAGASAGTATYEPWGAPRSGSANLGGFGYTGELTDAETGFVYLRARYLDPAAGRFVQHDSWAGEATDPASLNQFAYVRNNPATHADPSGRCLPWCVIIPVVVTAIATALLTGDTPQSPPTTAPAWQPQYSPDFVGPVAQPDCDDLCQRVGYIGPASPGGAEWGSNAWLYQYYISGLYPRFGFYAHGTVPQLTPGDGGGPEFDGCRSGVLLEAKYNYGQFIDPQTMRPKSFWNGEQGLIDQARRQVIAAKGAPIQWHFSDQLAADWFRAVLQREGITGITVVYTPFP